MIIDYKKLHFYLASKSTPEALNIKSLDQDVVAFGFLFHKICAYLGWQSDPDKIGNYHQLYIHRVKVIDQLLTGLYLLAGGGTPTRYLEILRQQWFILYDPKSAFSTKPAPKV